jgi:hypothetical protein
MVNLVKRKWPKEGRMRDQAAGVPERGGQPLSNVRILFDTSVNITSP